MTIFSLQQQMESMAEERDDFIRKITTLECQVQELEFQKEAHLCKIQVLESLVHKGKDSKVLCVDSIKRQSNSDDTTEMTSIDSDSSI